MYRGQYAQIAAKLGAMTGEKDVTLHYADGSSKKVSAASATKLAENINPHKAKNVVGVEITDYKPTIGGRVADLTTSLAAPIVSGAEFISGGDVKKPGEGNSAFAQQWYSASPTNSSQQTFNRIAAGSQLLDQVAGGSPKFKAAARFGSFVGQHGPAAETVFGPPARRMAYRYRGTERRPERSLTTAYSAAIHSAKSQSGRHTPEENLERAPNWQEREAGREQIIGWLQQEGRAPSRALSALQLASGHTPPSEGVLLNADGQIVTTAVGSGDDWYLPFNLRHLQSLKGGEYVRSRSTGGLTTEDIYTGLMTGARRVTVVSRSGVYSIEFDPELRGGRRNNDKALRMSQRYAELLDAVQSGKVERQRLSPEAMNEIRHEVDSQYGTGISAAERKVAIDHLIQERRDNPGAIDAKIEELEQQRAKIEEDRELIPDEKTSFDAKKLGLLSQREYFFRLNGLGYKAAQEALKEQFPYYIASANTTWQVGRSAPIGPNDPGYVEPGAIRPTAARANLFGGALGPSDKDTPPTRFGIQQAQSARTADRARPLVDRYPAGTNATEAKEGEGATGGGGGGAAMPKPRESDVELKARAARNEKLRTAAVKVHGGLDSWAKVLVVNGKPAEGAEALVRYHNLDPITFAGKMREPGEVEKFHEAVTAAAKRIEGGERTPDGEYNYPGRTELEAAVGPKGGGTYDYGRAAVAPLAVFHFPDLTTDEKLKAAVRPLALSSKMAGQATADELDSEATLRAAIDQLVQDFPSGTPGRATLIDEALSAKGFVLADDRARTMVGNYIADPNALKDSMRAIQVQRAANANLGHAPVVPAAGASEGPLAIEGRKHPSGREFTAEEMRQGWFWDENEKRRREI
jgi:hypothetical protein